MRLSALLAARDAELGLVIWWPPPAPPPPSSPRASPSSPEPRPQGRPVRHHPDIPALLANGEIQLVVNTTAGRRAAYDAGSIRRAALDGGVPYLTTIPGAFAAAEAIAALRRGPLSVRALQDDAAGQPPWAAVSGGLKFNFEF